MPSEVAMPNWLIPINGRRPSSSDKLNFLWQEANVYFMDNHLAAAWCWFQSLPVGTKADLVHIDQHYDTQYVDPYVVASQVGLLRGPLESYLDALMPGDEHKGFKLFTWDNYIPIAIRSCASSFRCANFFTSRVGNQPANLGIPPCVRIVVTPFDQPSSDRRAA